MTTDPEFVINDEYVEELGKQAWLVANKVAKWRTVLAGRLIGTSVDDPRAKGYKDLCEKLILYRADLNALTALLIKKGVFTQVEFTEQNIEEMVALDEAYEQQFPGFKTSQEGLIIGPEAKETTRGWPT